MEPVFSDISQWKWPIVLSLAICAFAANSALSKRKLPLPPGPTGWPVVGNLFQIPQTSPWVVYKEWAKQYGGITYLNAMGQDIVVVNDLRTAVDLLEKRAINTSDRVGLPSLDILGLDWAFSLMPYGTEWRVRKRAFHYFFGRRQVSEHYPVIEQECLTYLRELAKTPEKLFKHSRLYFGSTLMRLSYGGNDPRYRQMLIEDGEEFVVRFSSTSVPGRLLVNTFPILRHVPEWLPGAGWKRYLKDGATINARLVPQPYYNAKTRLMDETDTDELPSLVKTLVEQLGSKTDPDYSERERIAMGVCAETYVAGVDTSFSTTGALFAALTRYPEVQARAQAEIDAVTGGNRLPVPDDMPHLPYIEAIVKETIRLFPSAPLGVPHATTADDDFNGYLIPKKTVILPNSWAMLRDPEMFEEPDEFRPERYLKDGKLDPSTADPSIIAFGFGRRVCPGRHFGSLVLKYTAASFLAVFNIQPMKDETGNEVPVTVEYTSDLIRFLKPFKCDIKPRSPKHASWLE
ncbi:cytochrome P450 98A3 [Coprinopsis marcescibilis]|uniref:Cytochrome P450 98A3 n=1 Tax=Coprinopsis marcescibilis TaxID=230819 RepID=A0A5C3KU49_COPMA|nr:cytochrome P450 98A3 [Coprinopsis marcescibilis]